MLPGKTSHTQWVRATRNITFLIYWHGTKGYIVCHLNNFKNIWTKPKYQTSLSDWGFYRLNGCHSWVLTCLLQNWTYEVQVVGFRVPRSRLIDRNFFAYQLSLLGKSHGTKPWTFEPWTSEPKTFCLKDGFCPKYCAIIHHNLRGLYLGNIANHL